MRRSSGLRTRLLRLSDAGQVVFIFRQRFGLLRSLGCLGLLLLVLLFKDGLALGASLLRPACLLFRLRPLLLLLLRLLFALLLCLAYRHLILLGPRLFESRELPLFRRQFSLLLLTRSLIGLAVRCFQLGFLARGDFLSDRLPRARRARGRATGRSGFLRFRRDGIEAFACRPGTSGGLGTLGLGRLLLSLLSCLLRFLLRPERQRRLLGLGFLCLLRLLELFLAARNALQVGLALGLDDFLRGALLRHRLVALLLVALRPPLPLGLLLRRLLRRLDRGGVLPRGLGGSVRALFAARGLHTCELALHARQFLLLLVTLGLGRLDLRRLELGLLARRDLGRDTPALRAARAGRAS